MRGEATVFTADSIDTFSNDEVVAAFRQAREPDYAALMRDAEAMLARRSARAPARRIARRARQLSDRLRELDAIAFFPPPNREAASASVAKLDKLAHGGGEPPAEATGDRLDPARFQKRVWVTRPRPGVDRMSSGWLIRRFIDPRARFVFADAPPPAGGGVPFDMYGVEFSHTDHGCTFETLVRVIRNPDPALRQVAEIVHDIDLKDEKFARPDAPGVQQIVLGIVLDSPDDEDRLRRGFALLDDLYASFRKRNPLAKEASK